jgi:hypothetical protein
LAKGFNGHRVRAGTWRNQPVAVKLLRQGGVLAARSRRTRGGGAPVRSAAARSISVEPTRCCLVTELAPFCSLKSMLESTKMHIKLVRQFLISLHDASDALHLCFVFF